MSFVVEIAPCFAVSFFQLAGMSDSTSQTYSAAHLIH